MSRGGCGIDSPVGTHINWAGMPDTAEFRERVLELERHLLQTRIPISQEVLLDEDFFTIYFDEYLLKRVVVNFRGYIWGKENDPIIVHYPSNWWQAFKAQFFPEWALRRWPVDSIVVRIEVRELYPEYRHPVAGRRTVVTHMEVTNGKIPD